MLVNCFVCSKSERVLLNIYQNNILNKLKDCVPEVDWIQDFRICESCLESLNKAYEFKKLCIDSYVSLKTSSYFNDKKPFLDDDTLEGELCDNDHDFKDQTETNTHSNEFCETESTIQQNQITSCESVDVKETLRICPDDGQQDRVLPTCSHCRTTFKNKYLLKRHYQNVHFTEKKFKCDMCARHFTSSVYLNAHKRYHSRDRTHICLFCGKGFITASDLYHHEKIHANKRDYQCEICPKAFNTSSDLHKHKICVHSEKTNWKYVCSYCEKKFPLKSNLDMHTKVHTGEKNYSCHLCNKKFINKSKLTRHIESHSSITFKCDLCFQGYKYKKSLNLHMAKVHKIGDFVDQVPKKFSCELCSKSYFVKNKLQKHLKSHDEVKSSKGKGSNKTFGNKQK